MAYGGIKFDNITFTNAGVDANTTVSGIYKAITSGVTVTGTISGNLVQGATVSGTTVTGTSANFASGVFTTQISGTIGIFGAGSATAPGLAVGVGTTYKPGIYSPGTDQLAISTGGTGRLFVDANGLTKLDSGINAATLTLNSTNPYGTLLNFADTNAVFGVIGGAGAVVSGADKNDFVILYNGTNASRNLIFSSSSTEKMRITAAGNVGIGTSSPLSVLDVQTNATERRSIRFSGTGLSNAEIHCTESGGYNRDFTFGGSTLAFYIGSGGATSRSEVARIDSSGRLLVGTSTATGSFLLQINTTDATIFGVRVGRGGGAISNNTAVGAVALNVNTTGSDNTAIGNAALVSNTTGNSNTVVGSFALYSNTTGVKNTALGWAALYSCSTGNNNTANGIQALSSCTGSNNIALGYQAGLSLTTGSNNTIIGSIAGTAGLSDTVIIGAGTTERLRIDSSGRLLVGTSTANTSGAKLQTYDGLTFPATQVASSDPNTLDDYEEGTFTPTVIGLTTAGTGTYSTQIGKYTKIGRLVTVEVFMDWSAHTGTGNMAFSGLPFTIPVGTGSPGASLGFVNNINFTAGYYLTAYAAANSTAVILQQNLVGGGASNTVPIDTVAAVTYSLTYAI